MITKNVKLYLGDGFPVRIPVSQFDTMWQFVFEIIHNSQPWQIPTGATAVLNGRKPDGNVFAFSGTIENNTVTVDADVQMTAVAGQTVCELSILADSKTIGTANFILDVEEAPKSADDVVSDTVLDGYGMMVTNAVDDYIERHPEVFGGDKFTTSAKNALLALLEKVAYIDENGQTYIDALESELFPPASLVSITAVFNQGSAVIYDTDSLDTLKQYLTVAANMSDGSTQTVSNYTLSGTLTEGTSVITVSYGGKTTTFNVIVSEDTALYKWDFKTSLVDEKQGLTAIPTGATQTANGLMFSAQQQAVDLGVGTYARNRTYEIDVSDFDMIGNSAYNVRFVMYGTGADTGTGLLIWRHEKTIGWSAYNGAWASAIYGSLTERNVFADSTIKIQVASDGTTKLFINGEEIGTSSAKASATESHLYFGTISSYIYGGNFYNATITGLRIYEGVV